MYPSISNVSVDNTSFSHNLVTLIFMQAERTAPGYEIQFPYRYLSAEIDVELSKMRLTALKKYLSFFLDC